MEDLLNTLKERIKGLGSNWTAYSVVGTFSLYVLGYLALRFHLTALGVSTDLAVLDERYLFTGANFVVFVVLTLVSAGLVCVLLSALAYFPFALLPQALRARLADRGGSLVAWCCQPKRLLLFGIVFTLAVIQFPMRECIKLHDLLLRQSLPHSYLSAWLISEGEGRLSLFFLGLVVACAISLLVLLAARTAPIEGNSHLLLRSLLTVLFAVQLLMLPINFGYLVLNKSVPRVVSLDGVTRLSMQEEAWLVWEGKTGATYLLRDRRIGQYSRVLVTLRWEEIKRVEIVSSDKILRVLFSLGGEP